jgi:hypothetical protein
VSVLARTTLDSSPIPNQMMHSGASATRGMPLAATMNGSSTRARKSRRASTTPTAMPATLPSRKPRNVSRSVARR